MTIENKTSLLEEICKISKQAGDAILTVYDSEFSVDQKDDKSPLTEADRKSHEVIDRALKMTDFPVLSEEGRGIAFQERKDWEYLWIVDPLDGTKEFVKRNGEFTVNIALVRNGKAVLGVIYVPVKDEMYFGAEGVGSFKVSNYKKVESEGIKEWMSSVNKLPFKMDRKYTIVGSRSHMSAETEEYIAEKRKEVGDIEMISVGSSLKLCMVAEGKADAYPRFAPTMEWDTAAGQAIVESMGGSVINWKTKETMLYNRENLLNDWFLVTK
ncbi:MAG: 3'(2'),5'-bisphosphate nucleotidase [Bacteroidetes bacterium]|nr:MAG: 3'(2'),5'-bisphosphate nucleotidase [Bacteroidota bacterium]MBL1143337.1 3'(2'),5'-bisphosphate nucleotidase [Bacteroidota bacterium]MCB0801631.1 3'(2'),5'-bisphosphate nucleotidase CysQ [Flavobacteriales bacterium]NOG56139.1 3'(2'),5'-bisphosphate nucleotidase CysQ [Bacteroidota bacterium]